MNIINRHFRSGGNPIKTAFSALSLLLLLSLTSCEDFLTQTPKYNLVKENAVIDYSTAKNAVNGIYAKLANNKVLGGEIPARLAAMAGIHTYVSTEVYYNMAYRENSSDGSDIWQNLYAVVNASNAAIYGVENLDNSKFPSAEEKQRLIAEARCCRAFAHLQIHWLWSHWWEKADCPYGIIYKDAVSDLSNLHLDRLTVGESYDRIIEDLEFAEQYLNNFQTSRYMSRQFAQVLHAKLLLNRGWEGDYAKALELVNEVKAAKTDFQLETDLPKVYQQSWDSKDVLFARYLGDYTSTTDYEFFYSYQLYYTNTLTEIPQEWMEADPRFALITSTGVRAPETWDTERVDKPVYTKLYHNGRIDGKSDAYATYYFRYPELYLMEAELKARINPSNVTAALAPLNELRGKYVNPELQPLKATNINEFYDVLFKEIVVSLCLENGSEWFAALRINKDGKPWIYTLKPDVSISPDKFCWPIPHSEMIYHTNNILQNPTLE